MALMMSKLYLALRRAGVDEDEASEAAEEAASHDNRRTKVEGDLTLVKWMVGFNLAMSAAILVRVFA